MRAYGLIQLLDEAAAHLGDPKENSRALAIRSLFGLTGDTRGHLLMHRRKAAALALGIGVRTLTKNYEDAFLEDLCAEVYRLMFLDHTKNRAG